VSLSLVVVLVGFVSSVLSPTIQTRLMDVAGDNQSIAAAMNHSALNIGNSLGAFLGGIVIAVGWGFTAPAWTGAVLAVAGLLIALVSYRVEARRVAQTPVLAS
jgi:MFS transporter, DHA1 family, inner membrane transport protein